MLATYSTSRIFTIQTRGHGLRQSAANKENESFKIREKKFISNSFLIAEKLCRQNKVNF